METKPVTLTFQLPPEQRRALKILAARLNVPVRALLADQIAALLCENESHDPSSITKNPSDPARLR